MLVLDSESLLREVVLYVTKSMTTYVDDKMTEKKYFSHTSNGIVNKLFPFKTHSFGALGVWDPQEFLISNAAIPSRNNAVSLYELTLSEINLSSCSEIIKAQKSDTG